MNWQEEDLKYIWASVFTDEGLRNLSTYCG